MTSPPERLGLFATPALVADVPHAAARNRELAERLLADEAATPGLRRSNLGGWHSPPDLADRPEPCFRELTEIVVGHTRHLMAELARVAGQPVRELAVETHAWAMIMRDGDYSMLHDHGDAHFSAVYWVDAGDEVPAHPQSGLLVLCDPRRAGRALPDPLLQPPNSIIKPCAGSLVLFPGWLQHYVHPYRGARPRISLSWNLIVT